MPASELHEGSDGNSLSLINWSLAIAYAALSLCAAPPLSWWPLTFLAPIPLVVLAGRLTSKWSVLLIPGIVGVALWFWINRWVADVTTLGYPLMSLYLGLYPWLFVVLWRRLEQRSWWGRVPATLGLPVVWVAVEYIRGRVLLSGYPWMCVGHPLVDAPVLAQSANLFGSYFVSFIAMIPAGMVLDLQPGLRRPGTSMNRRVVAAIAGVIVLAANVGWGLWCLRGGPVPKPEEHFNVLVVQTNLPQDNKVGWTVEQQNVDLPEFFRLTDEAMENAANAGVRVDLVVWPETMLPGAGLESDTIRMIQSIEAEPGQFASLYRWSIALVQYAREKDVPFLIGSEAWTEPRLDDLPGGGVKLGVGARFNSAYLVWGETPFQRYDKTTLTPFGEEIPYLSAWPWLEQKLVALGAEGMSFNLDRGESFAPLEWSEGERTMRISIPICFEDMRGDVVRRMVANGGGARADVLVNLSNDGWFGSSVTTRMIHAQIARFRCIENGVPMVRSVNTGFSLACDAHGRIMRTVGHETPYGTPMESGTFLAPISPFDRFALYTGVGDVWPAGCLCLVVAGMAMTIRRRRKADEADVRSREGNQS